MRTERHGADGDDSPLVSLLVKTWNNRDVLTRCLESIREYTTYPNYEIVVVDNNSEDGTQETVRREFPDVNLITNATNVSAPKATNQGLTEAEGEFVVHLDDDVEMTHEGWLENLVRTAERDRVGIVGCKLVYPDGTTQHEGGRVSKLRTFHYQDGEQAERLLEPSQYEYVCGACFLMTRELVETIGGWDEDYDPYHYDEVDYCMRCYESGFEIAYTPETVITHHEGGSREDKEHESRSDLSHYFVKRKNRLQFVLRHFALVDLLLQIPAETVYLARVFFTRRDRRSTLAPTNVALRPFAVERFKYFLVAYLVILRSLPEHLRKRRS